MWNLSIIATFGEQDFVNYRKCGFIEGRVNNFVHKLFIWDLDAQSL